MKFILSAAAGAVGVLVTLVFIPEITSLDLKEGDTRWDMMKKGMSSDHLVSVPLANLLEHSMDSGMGTNPSQYFLACGSREGVAYRGWTQGLSETVKGVSLSPVWYHCERWEGALLALTSARVACRRGRKLHWRGCKPCQPVLV